MDCSDGSLCRITSSAKEPSNQTVIVKVPDEDLSHFNHFPYKLITIEANVSNCEPSSDEDDEERKEYELFLKSLEEDKKTDSYKFTETNNNTNKEHSTDNYHKRQHFRESKGSNYSRLNRRRRIYNPSQGGRTYNVSGSGSSYQNCSSNTSGDIDPWLTPILPMRNMQGGFQYSSYPHFVNSLDSHIPPNVNCDVNPTHSLLQNPPYTPMSHQFHSPNQTNAFAPCQNYWNSEYRSSDYPDYQRPCPPGNSNTFQRSVPPVNSKNYQRSGPSDRPVSGRQDNRNNFHNGRNFWRKKSGKRFNERNRNRKEKGRNKSTSGYYNNDYRK